MNSYPLVSVVMPFFKQGEYLLEAAMSVHTQTYPNVELVVVDDCSPGEPARELLQPLGLAGVKVIRNEQNCGVSQSRNIGISSAKGDFILPLDSDDKISPDYLTLTVEAALSSPQSAGVYTYTQVFGDASWVWKPIYRLPEYLALGGPGALLYRKEILVSSGGYRQELKHGEDFDLLVGLLGKGCNFTCIPEPLFYYRRHAHNATNTVDWTEQVSNLLRYHKDLCHKYSSELVLLNAERYHREEVEFERVYKQQQKVLGLMRQYSAMLSTVGQDIDQSAAKDELHRRELEEYHLRLRLLGSVHG